MKCLRRVYVPIVHRANFPFGGAYACKPALRNPTYAMHGGELIGITQAASTF